MHSHGREFAHGRGRARRRVAIGVAVATIALLALTILPSSASSSVPQLKVARTKSGWNQVSWTFTTTDHAQDMQLQIDRGVDVAHLAKWVVVNRPEKKSYRYDKDGKATTVYRARLTVKGVVGGWSNVFSLSGVTSTAPPSTSSPTTARPTTTSTSTSTTTTTIKPTTTTTTVKRTTTTTVPVTACTNARAEMLAAVNRDRKSLGRAPLQSSPKLDKAAQYHSDWSAASTRNRGHADDHGSGVADQSKYYGYAGWGWIGQNIAGGQVDANDAEHAWFTEAPAADGSTVHRTTLLDSRAKYIGVGCARDVGGTYWWTQDFGDVLG